MTHTKIKYLTIIMCILLFFSFDVSGKKKTQGKPTYSLPKLELVDSKLDSLLRECVFFTKNQGYDNNYLFYIQAFNQNSCIKLEFSLEENGFFDYDGDYGYLQYEDYYCIVSSQILLENLSKLFKRVKDVDKLVLEKKHKHNPINICETYIFMWIFQITENCIKEIDFDHKYPIKNDNYNITSSSTIVRLLH